MIRPRIAAVAVGAASLLALSACGEPAGQVSGSGMAYTVTADTQYLRETGTPLLRAVALCEGATSWIAGAWVNADLATTATTSATVWCYPRLVIAGSWETTHS